MSKPVGRPRLFDHDAIYLLLDSGFPQTRTAKIVGTSQQYINRLARRRAAQEQTLVSEKSDARG